MKIYIVKTFKFIYINIMKTIEVNNNLKNSLR